LKGFRKIFFLFFVFIAMQGISQSSIPQWCDSLKLSLPDSVKVQLHEKIAGYYLDSDYDKSIKEYETIIDIYKKNSNEKGQIEVFQTLSNVFLFNNQRNKAITQLNKALQIAMDMGNDTIVSELYKSLGYAFEQKSDYKNAITNYLTSLSYKEKLNDIRGQASNYNSIGLIYYYQKNYKQALDNFQKALNLVEQIDFKYAIASILTNMANIYMKRDADKVDSINIAIGYYEKSLNIAKEMNDKYSIASTLHNIGVSHFAMVTSLSKTVDNLKNQEDTLPESLSAKKDSLNKKIEGYQNMITAESDSALSYYFNSIDIKNEINDSVHLSISYLNIATVEDKQEKYNEALKHLEIALNLAKKYQLNDLLVSIYDEMSFAYGKIGKYEDAYNYKSSYDDLKDSLAAQNLNKTLAELQEKYENDKKEKEIALQRSKIKQQTTFQTALIIFIILLVLLAFVILRGYRNKRKANLLLEEQNAQIEAQKNEIEGKNKDIMDSINYARRIQQAILPPPEVISQIFPQHFILFKPKDIVSGDFYWLDEKNGKKFASAVDCTGHGVPGAFMSIVGANGLDKTVDDLNIYHPGEILDRLSLIVEDSLRQKGKTTVRDGMDLSLIMMDKKASILEFSGANNPLYIIREKGLTLKVNGEEKMPAIEGDTYNLFEIKGDKQPIGAVEERHQFTNHVLTMEKGDRFFLFSDGYADQFGGPKNKKFMYKPFKRLLLNMATQNISENKELLDKTFEDWKGEYEQIDDVCVVGVAND